MNKENQKLLITLKCGKTQIVDGVVKIENYAENPTDFLDKMSVEARKYYAINQNIPAESKEIHERLSNDKDVGVRRYYALYQRIPAEFKEIHERVSNDEDEIVRRRYAENESASPIVVEYMKYMGRI